MHSQYGIFVYDISSLIYRILNDHRLTDEDLINVIKIRIIKELAEYGLREYSPYSQVFYNSMMVLHNEQHYKYHRFSKDSLEVFIAEEIERKDTSICTILEHLLNYSNMLGADLYIDEITLHNDTLAIYTRLQNTKEYNHVYRSPYPLCVTHDVFQRYCLYLN